MILASEFLVFICLLPLLIFLGISCLGVALMALAFHTARRRAHQGHWWGKYVLGLHALLRPVYLSACELSPALGRWIAIPYQLLTLPFGIELPLSAQVGCGLTLSHTSGVVMHANAKVGDDCILHSGVVIGGRGRNDPPTIGNNVYIGANTVIAGPVTIGDHATLGAGALITFDVPAWALVAAAPAKIVKEHYKRPYYTNQTKETDSCLAL